ncbi:e1 -activating enzyme gsa7p apg7p [Pyrenophora seminiperda CCB06]|uniref:Ubiquitin-like modifier-activating enzyme ATG7 n=1 Tax=Pyrenophora seminiperda CCB06 TaxID=1302712 RepID=A0A3M7MGP3_9PLEO|nr:e1 -activating enzyme gsa7p apg7p [Pyrenophora seminiperda CCB06]
MTSHAALGEQVGRLGVNDIALIVHDFCDADLSDLGSTGQAWAGIAVQGGILANAITAGFEERIFLGMKADTGGQAGDARRTAVAAAAWQVVSVSVSLPRSLPIVHVHPPSLQLTARWAVPLYPTCNRHKVLIPIRAQTRIIQEVESANSMVQRLERGRRVEQLQLSALKQAAETRVRRKEVCVIFEDKGFEVGRGLLAGCTHALETLEADHQGRVDADEQEEGPYQELRYYRVVPRARHDPALSPSQRHVCAQVIDMAEDVLWTDTGRSVWLRCGGGSGRSRHEVEAGEAVLVNQVLCYRRLARADASAQSNQHGDLGVCSRHMPTFWAMLRWRFRAPMVGLVHRRLQGTRLSYPWAPTHPHLVPMTCTAAPLYGITFTSHSLSARSLDRRLTFLPGAWCLCPAPVTAHVIGCQNAIVSAWVPYCDTVPSLHRNTPLPTEHYHTNMATLKFAPWLSDVDVQFYAALANIKINHDKLDDSARKVLGLYEVRPSEHSSRSMRVQIHPNALTSDETPPNFCPIIFANLKKYKFTYHFGFPAIQSDPPWKQVGEATRLQARETTYLVDAVQTWRYSSDVRQRGFFLAKRIRGGGDTEERPKTPVSPLEEFGYTWTVGRLEAYEKGFFDKVDSQDRFICFADPSTYETNPGWPLRNLLILMRHRWHLNDAQVMCYRDTHTRRDQPNSLILQLHSDPDPALDTASVVPASVLSDQSQAPKLPKVTGWERTEAGKLTSRNVDLSEYMDERKLADQAVDLNLKLIKWRIAPTIDLDVIKNCKCLLLGAGTLGTYVSRTLMGWGVRNITFIDNATVSFSNPVRQPLFNFQDCLNGGAKKAERAAQALEEIYPGVNATGHVMEVPMLGHPMTDAAKTKAEFEKLQQLISEHDAIFLLMDTRESRWLPTVMGKAHGKIVLNAALGFDTYVVMRHGLKSTQPGEVELGCYFCNDVVAPADSLSNATLDQQCTVTRPGVAPLASSLLVELLISLLQHPLQARAPPPSQAAKSAPSSSHPSLPPPFQHPLGIIPHTIRGYLSNFSNLQVEGKPYDCCSACSDVVLEAYNKDPWAFVQRALEERGWVEEMSGLKEVQRRADEASEGLEWDEEEGGIGRGVGWRGRVVVMMMMMMMVLCL